MSSRLTASTGESNMAAELLDLNGSEPLSIAIGQNNEKGQNYLVLEKNVGRRKFININYDRNSFKPKDIVIDPNGLVIPQDSYLDRDRFLGSIADSIKNDLEASSENWKSYLRQQRAEFVKDLRRWDVNSVGFRVGNAVNDLLRFNQGNTAVFGNIEEPKEDSDVKEPKPRVRLFTTAPLNAAKIKNLFDWIDISNHPPYYVAEAQYVDHLHTTFRSPQPIRRGLILTFLGGFQITIEDFYPGSVDQDKIISQPTTGTNEILEQHFRNFLAGKRPSFNNNGHNEKQVSVALLGTSDNRASDIFKEDFKSKISLTERRVIKA